MAPEIRIPRIFLVKKFGGAALVFLSIGTINLAVRRGLEKTDSCDRTATHMHSLHALITFVPAFLASGKSNSLKKICNVRGITAT